MVELLHGIQAYSGRGLLSQLRERAQFCHEATGATEICCANRAIGSIGLMLSGDVVGLYARDCWSIVKKDGSREATRAIYDGYRCENRAASIDEVLEMIDDHIDAGSYYAEFWLRNPTITGVWVRDGESELMKKFADFLGRKYNVPVWEVKKGYKHDATIRAEKARMVQDVPTILDQLEQDIMGY